MKKNNQFITEYNKAPGNYQNAEELALQSKIENIKILNLIIEQYEQLQGIADLLNNLIDNCSNEIPKAIHLYVNTNKDKEDCYSMTRALVVWKIFTSQMNGNETLISILNMDYDRLIDELKKLREEYEGEMM